MLTRFDVCRPNHSAPGSKNTYWNRSSFFKSQTRWLGLDFIRLCESILSVSACHDTVDFIAFLESGDICSNSFDDPGTFHSRCPRELKLHELFIKPRTHLPIGWVDACRFEPDQYLIGI